MAKSNNTISFIKRHEHRSRVMTLRIKGHTFEQIGQIMAEEEGRDTPYSKQAIFKTVSNMLEESRQLLDDEVEVLRAIEADRLDLLMQIPFKRAIEEGDLRSIDRVLKIMERRAKLLGLDRPAQQQSMNDDHKSQVVFYVPDNGRGPDEKRSQ